MTIDVGVAIVVGALVARLLEQPRHPLGVVVVHLAAERLDQVFHLVRIHWFRAFRSDGFAFALYSLSPSPAAFRARPASTAADDFGAANHARDLGVPARRPSTRVTAVVVRPPFTDFSIRKCVAP